MIVSSDNAKLILQRRKTQLRLPKAPTVPCPVRSGRTYTLQVAGSNRPGMKITVLTVFAQQLSDITLSDIRAEGHTTRRQFLSAWPHTTQAVWAVIFKLGDHLDHPRLLAKRSEQLYTASRYNSLPQEPEAVPAAWQAAQSAKQRSADLSALHEALRVARGREALLQDDLATYRGQDPKDIAMLAPHQGEAHEIRSRRRHMKLRAIDGLPDLTPDMRRQAIQQMRERNATVSQIALALDCSRRYAHDIQRSWTTQFNTGADIATGSHELALRHADDPHSRL